MLEVGDLVFMEEDKYEVAIYGIVIGFDSEAFGLQFYTIDWFDGQTSTESENNLIKEKNNG